MPTTVPAEGPDEPLPPEDARVLLGVGDDVVREKVGVAVTMEVTKLLLVELEERVVLLSGVVLVSVDSGRLVEVEVERMVVVVSGTGVEEVEVEVVVGVEVVEVEVDVVRVEVVVVLVSGSWVLVSDDGVGRVAVGVVTLGVVSARVQGGVHHGEGRHDACSQQRIRFGTSCVLARRGELAEVTIRPTRRARPVGGCIRRGRARVRSHFVLFGSGRRVEGQESVGRTGRGRTGQSRPQVCRKSMESGGGGERT